MAGEHAGMACVLQLDTDVPGWHISMIKLFKSIEDVSYSIDAQEKLAHVSGKINNLTLLKWLAKARTHVLSHQINYGIDLPKPTSSEPTMKCVLLVDTDFPSWHKTMSPLLQSMQGVRFHMNALTKQAYISGKISPALQLKLLAKAEAQAAARLWWLSYGYDYDPYGRPVPKESDQASGSNNNNPTPTPKPKKSFCCFM